MGECRELKDYAFPAADSRLLDKLRHDQEMWERKWLTDSRV